MAPADGRIAVARPFLSTGAPESPRAPALRTCCSISTYIFINVDSSIGAAPAGRRMLKEVHQFELFRLLALSLLLVVLCGPLAMERWMARLRNEVPETDAR